MNALRRHGFLSVIATFVLGATAWAGFAPIKPPPREALFEIPQGTWARRMSGSKIEILPAEIRLTLGLRDILVLRNLDDVPQIFGPTLMMPGQSLRLTVRGGLELHICLHGAPERTDDHCRGSLARVAVGPDSMARA